MLWSHCGHGMVERDLMIGVFSKVETQHIKQAVS